MRLSSPFFPLETLCFMGCFKVLLSRCRTLRHKRIALCGEGSKCWVGGGLRLPSGSNPGRKQGWIFQNNTLQRSAPALTFELRTRLKIWSNARSREQRLQSLITHSYHFKHNALATHTHTHIDNTTIFYGCKVCGAVVGIFKVDSSLLQHQQRCKSKAHIPHLPSSGCE